MPRVIRSPEWILSWKPKDSRCSCWKIVEPQVVGDLLADALAVVAADAGQDALDRRGDDDQHRGDPEGVHRLGDCNNACCAAGM